MLGGHHPTAMPQSVMESTAVDFVLRGEGEVSMPLLAGRLAEGGSLDSIPGLVLRQNGGKLQIKPPAGMQDPEDYPLPAVHLVKKQFYRRKQGGSLVVVTGRGCPLKCSYCSVGTQSFLAYRKRSVDSVVREIENADRHADIGFIDFEDENLSLERRWFVNLLQALQSRFGPGRFELRAMNGLYPPTLDEQVVSEMKAAGFRTLNLSLGSSSARQLKRFSRPDVRDYFERALDLAENYGLDAVGYIICAAPFQHASDSVADLIYLARRRVLAGVSVFYPAPGSRDFDLCREHDLLPADFSLMRSSALPLSHTTSRKEAVTLLRLARILNFMKLLLDQKLGFPGPDPGEIKIDDPADRLAAGRQLLSRFLADGTICGVTPQGKVFEHHICPELCRRFLAELTSIKIRGTK